MTVFQTVERVRARFKNFKSSKKKVCTLCIHYIPPPLLSILYSLFQVQSSSFSLDAQEEEEQRKKEGKRRK